MNYKKILLPVAAAIAIFLVIDLVYFRHGLKENVVLSQGDITQHKGASKELADYRKETGSEALWTNSMFGGMPAFQISTLYANKALKFIHNSFQLFLPHPAGYVCLYFIGFYILMLCLRINSWVGIVCSVAYAFSSYFFLILIAGHNSKAVALGYAPPLLGAVMLLYQRKWLPGFALTILFMGLEIYANHPQITYYIFLLLGLLIFWKGITALREKTLLDFAKASGLLVIAMLIGIGPSVSLLWSTAEYGKHSIRGPSELTINADGTKNENKKALPFDYALHYSYGVSESFSLLIPNFKGGGSGNTIEEALNGKQVDNIKPEYYDDVMQRGSYFGEQTILAGPVYAGAIIVLMSLFALFYVRSDLKWPLVVGALLALMLSWGRFFPSFSEIFFNYFPYYNKFRAVSMMLVVVELVLPILAALTLNQMIQDREAVTSQKIQPKEPPYKRGLIMSVSAVVLFLLTCLAAPKLINDFTSSRETVSNYEKALGPQLKEQLKQKDPFINEEQINQQISSLMPQYVEGYKQFLPELEKARISIFRKDVLRSLLFVVLGGALLFLFAYRKIKFELFIASLGILVLADMWLVNQRYLNKDSFVERTEDGGIEPSPADEYILADKNAINYRVANLATDVFNNATTSYFHHSIGGYHGAKLKRYQEMVEFHIWRELQAISEVADSRMPDSTALQYLGGYTPVLNMLNTRYIITRKNISGTPYKNPAANGNAWFVSSVKWVPNSDSEIVSTGRINTNTTAVIQEKFKAMLASSDKITDAGGTIRLDEYKPNHLKYSTESRSNQLAVFSEIWYPDGWNAYVDGKLTPHACANYILRAIMIPEGKHIIEFKFEPQTFYTGEKISNAGVILFYLSVFGGLGFYLYRQLKTARKPLAE